MQIQVHQCHLEGVSDQFVSIEGFVLQKLLVLTAEGVVAGIGQEFLCGQEEAAAAAAWVSDGLARLRAQALDHSLDQRTGCKILASTGFDILRVLLKQTFVDLALDVGGHNLHDQE